MALGARIKQLLAERGWSHHMLALRTGIPRPTITAIANDTRKASAESFVRLARAFGVPVEELHEAAGYGVAAARGRRRQETPEEILERLRMAQPVTIPVYERFPAPIGMTRETPAEYIYRPRSEVAGAGIEAYRADGWSLEPDIRNGDIVIVDRDRTADVGDVLLGMTDDGLVVGRLQMVGGEGVLENSNLRVKLKDCRTTAVVIEVNRRVKQ